MKIPKDVSGLRRKLIQAAVARANGAQPSSKTAPVATPDGRVQQARSEAIKLRHQARDIEKSNAEKDARIEALQNELNETKGKLDLAEPAAKRWNDYSHKEKERMITKLPKELQREAREMDVKHLKMFVDNYTGGGSAGTPGKIVGGEKKIGSLEEASKEDEATFNKFMDDVKAGTIKVDAGGKVIG